MFSHTINMIKVSDIRDRIGLIIEVVLLGIFIIFAYNGKVYAQERTEIDRAEIQTDSGVLSAVLTGVGELYIENTVITIKDGDKYLYTFAAPEGYSPAIEAYKFAENEELLFYSSQTGGSGGYGNYIAYRIKADGYEVIYDQAADSNEMVFSARFVDGGSMIIDGLTVDVTYMDKAFYQRIFDDQDNVIADMEKADVNDISIVFPYFNAALGVYQLMTYRSVVAIAQVNRLGYVSQNLSYDGRAFKLYFTEFSISI